MPLIRKPAGAPEHRCARSRRRGGARRARPRHRRRALGGGPRGRGAARAACRPSARRWRAKRARACARRCSRASPASPLRRASRRSCRSCAPTTRSCAREPRTRCSAMKDVAWPYHRGVAAGPRCRRPDSRLRPRPRHAGRNGRAPLSATCSIRSRSRTSAPRPSRRSRRSAEPRRCPRWRAARSGFAATPFLEFSIKIAIDRIRSQATEPTCLTFRRSPRTSIAGFASSSTDEPGWSSPKRSAITSSAASSSACWPRSRAPSKTISRGCAPTCGARSSSSSTRSRSTRRTSIARSTSSRVSRRTCWPRSLKAKTRGDQIRIWSVPCSTGEEPYSIAIWLLENWPLVDQYDIEIVGSDIDTDAVALARAGVYGETRADAAAAALGGQVLRARRQRDLEDHRRLAPVRALHGRQHRRSGRDHSRTGSST